MNLMTKPLTETTRRVFAAIVVLALLGLAAALVRVSSPYALALCLGICGGAICGAMQRLCK